MQEIYTMIQNTGVTLVIVVIFLWQYVSDIKKKNEEEKDNNWSIVCLYLLGSHDFK